MVYLYKRKKGNLRGRKRLIMRFKTTSNLLKWVEKCITEDKHLNYTVSGSEMFI